jgi:hypothetical protein
VTPFQGLIAVVCFVVLWATSVIAIHETKEVRAELAQIKNFQQAKVAPLHEQMNEKLDRLTTGLGGR